MILRSCTMKIFSKFPTVNVSKLNFWLVICIAKNLIWTTLKMIFSIFRFFCTLRLQIYKYCPIITNHTSMEILLPLWLVLCSRVTYTLNGSNESTLHSFNVLSCLSVGQSSGFRAGQAGSRSQRHGGKGGEDRQRAGRSPDALRSPLSRTRSRTRKAEEARD